MGVFSDFFGGGKKESTTKTQFNDTVKPLAESASSALTNAAAPTFFPGSTVAPQSTDTQNAFGSLRNAAGQQQNIANTAQQGFDFTINNLLDPASNTALQGYTNGAINPIFDRLENKTLPGIGGQAIQAGQFGGTAQGNLVQDALQSATRNALDTTAQISSNAYQTSLDNYTQTLLNAANIQSNVATPGNTLLGSGGVQDAFAQSNVDAEKARFDFGQNSQNDFNFKRLAAASAVPGGSTTTTTGGGTNPINAAISAYLAYQTLGASEVVKTGEQ